MVQFYKPTKPRRQTLQSRRSLTVTIDHMTASGEGIVVSHRPPIVVSGALPGETHQITVTKQTQRHWQAMVAKRNAGSAHPARQTPPCQWFEQCGGCTTQFCEPKAMFAWKQEALNKQFQGFFKLNNLPWQAPVTGPLKGYRRKARLAYDGRNRDNIKLGFRAINSKDIVSIPSCMVLVSPLPQVMQILHKKLTTTHPQSIGHVTLLAYDNGVGITVNFVCVPNKKEIAFWRSLFDTLNDLHPRVDVFLHVKQQPQSAFIYDTDEPLFITPPMAEPMTAKLLPDANDFIQVNKQVNQEMVERALDWLSPNDTDCIVELFAGLGNFSYALTQRCRELVAVEGSHIMVQKAKQQAQQQGIANTQWLCANLNDTNEIDGLWQRVKAKSLLIDPSREGAEMVCRSVSKSTVKRIVYVSCHPQSWMRDAKILMAQQFRLAKLAVMDMFPHTPHTELLSLFERP